MLKKVVSYGETHPVTVIEAIANIIIVKASDNNEGYGLAGHGLTTLPAIGDKGKIVFAKGGPMGGYWQYYPESEKTKNTGV